MEFRKTITQKIVFEGVGLHTGAECTMSLIPAEAKQGINFSRTDLDDSVLINADVANLKSTIRGTNLSKKNIDIKTVEHILAAIYAAGIDDLLIELSGPEIPILDGSASDFINEIERVGLTDSDVEKEYLQITEAFTYKHEGTGAEYFVYPADKLSMTVMIDFDNDNIGQQHAELNKLADFKQEIACARTFAKASEIEELMQQDLIKGGNLSNALIFVDVDLDQEKWVNLSKKWNIEGVNKNDQGLLNGKSLNYTNEPARHKLLDLIGDLALLTSPIKGHIIAKKPGHTSNVALTELLKNKLKDQRRLQGIPTYDPSAEPVFDSEQIRQLIPHRYPFLLVDKIISITDTVVVGVKNVTRNEPFFVGHFPDNPVFPGVLQMEALGQTGGILALMKVDVPDEWDTYFLKMTDVKFKRMVVPGDTVLLKMELISPIRRGLVNMKGTAYVNNQIVSQGELLAQIVKKKS